MTDISTTIIIAVALACLITGISKAGLGGALGFIVTPMLTLVMPLSVALGLMLPILIIGDFFTLSAYWKRWDVRHVWILLGGAVIGVTLGTFVLTSVSPVALKRTLGVIILVFTTYKVFESRIVAKLTYTFRLWHGILAGSVAGFTSTLAHAGAPPATIYLLMQGLPPSTFIATSTLFFAVLNWIKAPYYYHARLFDFPLMLRLAWLTPLVPLGVWLGRQLVTRVERRRFEQIVIVLLFIAGILLLTSK